MYELVVHANAVAANLFGSKNGWKGVLRLGVGSRIDSVWFLCACALPN
jgi:hypothetical protein